MTPAERQELASIRAALARVEEELPKKIELSPEGAAKLRAILEIAIFLSTGKRFVQWFVTGLITLGAGVAGLKQLGSWWNS